MKQELKKLFKSRIFYFSLLILFLGVGLNFYAQLYLHKCELRGDVFPSLNDNILNRIPYINLAWLYDWVIIITLIFGLFYVVKKKKYDEFSYYLILFGILNLIRAIFVYITPFGPPIGCVLSRFGGFQIYNLGFFPSGHTGISFLIFLLMKGIYRWIALIFFILIVIALLFARGHYSIDIFSGIFFAYAIYMFGEKHLKKLFTKI